MIATQLEDIVREYLQAFEARDLQKCLSFYTDDATVRFQNSVYNGSDGIRDWHNERFDADLRMVRVDNISTSGDVVVIDGVATSKRLRAWKISSISGTMTAHFTSCKIRELEFGVRMDFW